MSKASAKRNADTLACRVGGKVERCASGYMVNADRVSVWFWDKGGCDVAADHVPEALAIEFAAGIVEVKP